MFFKLKKNYRAIFIALFFIAFFLNVYILFLPLYHGMKFVFITIFFLIAYETQKMWNFSIIYDDEQKYIILEKRKIFLCQVKKVEKYSKTFGIFRGFMVLLDDGKKINITSRVEDWEKLLFILKNN